MELKELRTKNVEELRDQFNQVRNEMRKLRLTSKQESNKAIFREKKKDLARLLTVISEKSVLQEQQVS